MANSGIFIVCPWDNAGYEDMRPRQTRSRKLASEVVKKVLHQDRYSELQNQTSKSALARLRASLEHVLGLALLKRAPPGIESNPHGRASIAIHGRSHHADGKNDAKRNDPRQLSP